MRSFLKSWLGMLVAVAVCVIYEALWWWLPEFRALVADDKGLAGILFYFPIAMLVCCLFMSYRYGWSLLRPGFLALIVPVIIIGPSFFVDIDFGSFLIGFFAYYAIYLVPGVMGEAAGMLVRRLTWGTVR